MANLRKGQIFVFFIFFLTAGVILAGSVIDLGMLSLTRQKMRRAADAAALAAAVDLQNGATADAAALQYAQNNGYTDGVDNVIVTPLINPTGNNPNWIRVTISAPYRFLFGPLIGINERIITVFSTAQYNSNLPISINLAGVYGQSNPNVTLSIRGQNSPYEHGDPYSVPTLDNGDPNPLYNPDGYSYKLFVPDNYVAINGTSMMKVEIWDPDSYGEYDSTGTRTTTTYKLFAPDQTPTDFSDDTQIATYTIGGLSTTSQKWISPTGFTVDTAVWGKGYYRIGVSSGAGYNANGFTLRAGPDTGAFNPDNGTKIMASGPLPIRFNKTGQVTMELGYVPANAAGTRLHVNKFDTEIGSTAITYTCSTLAQTWPGILAQNASWKEDVIEVPQNYPGGIWSANYYAGVTDVSLWSMWYEGMQDDATGFVVLVE